MAARVIGEPLAPYNARHGSAALRPLIGDMGKARVVLRSGGLLVALHLAPDMGIDFRKVSIAGRARMHQSDIQPISERHGLCEDLSTADDHDSIRAAPQRIATRHDKRRIEI